MYDRKDGVSQSNTLPLLSHSLEEEILWLDV